MFWCDGGETLRFEKVDASLVGAEIRFQPHEDNWCGWQEVEDFRIPLETIRMGVEHAAFHLGSHLVHDIFQRIWTINCKADEEEVGLWVGKRAQSIILFLSCCIPQGKLYSLACCIVCRLCDIVFEDSWDIFLPSISIGDTLSYLSVP